MLIVFGDFDGFVMLVFDVFAVSMVHMKSHKILY